MELLRAWEIYDLSTTTYVELREKHDVTYVKSRENRDVTHVKFREKHDKATDFLRNELQSSEKALKLRPK